MDRWNVRQKVPVFVQWSSGVSCQELSMDVQAWIKMSLECAYFSLPLSSRLTAIFDVYLFISIAIRNLLNLTVNICIASYYGFFYRFIYAHSFFNVGCKWEFSFNQSLIFSLIMINFFQNVWNLRYTCLRKLSEFTKFVLWMYVS